MLASRDSTSPRDYFCLHAGIMSNQEHRRVALKLIPPLGRSTSSVRRLS
jgi:hypothetical protein